MSTATASTNFMTPEEYLAHEEHADFKSEYFQGQLFAMAGTTATHSLVNGRLTQHVLNVLGDRPCLVFTADTKVKIDSTGLYTYPDLTITCTAPLFDDAKRMVLTNPQVVFEILSPSTEGYDRGDKFRHYERIASLRAYVLISQWEHHVEVFWRKSAEEDWTYSRAEGLDGVINIPSMELALRLSEIYKGVELAPRPIRVYEE